MHCGTFGVHGCIVLEPGVLHSLLVLRQERHCVAEAGDASTGTGPCAEQEEPFVCIHRPATASGGVPSVQHLFPSLASA